MRGWVINFLRTVVVCNDACEILYRRWIQVMNAMVNNVKLIFSSAVGEDQCLLPPEASTSCVWKHDGKITGE